MVPRPSRIRWVNQQANNLPPAPPTPSHPADDSETAISAGRRVRTPTIDKVGRDLTQLAREGKLPTLFGRGKELRKIQRILLRKQKSNPILIGAPGVGKTALVEGLAILIARGESSPDLSNLRIVEIIPSMLVAGTTYRGMFEARIQDILKEAKESSELVLFIDEFHTLIRAGAVEGGSLDAANILKPALARGEFRCIGSTTQDEYDKYIKSDPAFERRFEPLVIEEPTISEAIDILKCAVPSYEAYHNVHIATEAIDYAVRLSAQYILDRRLPDKAFDLLDTACTLVRVPEIESSQTGTLPTVTSETIAQALADKIGIPVEKLSDDTKMKLVGLQDFLDKKIIGQPLAISRIASSIQAAYAGLSKPDQPKCVFAFFGSSGVGKTETAKALAEFLFSSPDSIIRLDMSEYKEPHSISRLLGTPPGYIGFDDEGTFATRLRRQPFSIVLLDEVEKAHPQILDTFLHIFDEGRFTDTHGRLIDARQAVFILTSNLFSLSNLTSQDEYELHAETIRQNLVNFFRPEFVNRIKEIVLFRELGVEDLRRIAQAEISSLNLRLSQYEVSLKPSEDALNWIANNALDINSGARAVIRLIQKQIAEPISSAVIVGELRSSCIIEVIVQNETLAFNGLNKIGG